MTADTRAVSETMGVAALVALTFLITISVGISVIVAQQNQGDSGYDFQFTHSENLNQLVISYQDDKDFRAGDVIVDGPEGNATWAELAGSDPNKPVSQNVFLNDADQNAYGHAVAEDDFFQIVYKPSEGESEVLATWNEPGEGEEDDGGGFGPDDGGDGGDGGEPGP